MTAYIFAELEITDKVLYKDQYVPLALRAVGLHGGHFVGDGRQVSFRTGRASANSRTVLIEFSSFDAANAFYDSPEYQAASAVRQRCTITYKYVILGGDRVSSSEN